MQALLVGRRLQSLRRAAAAAQQAVFKGRESCAVCVHGTWQRPSHRCAAGSAQGLNLMHRLQVRDIAALLCGTSCILRQGWIASEMP